MHNERQGDVLRGWGGGRKNVHIAQATPPQLTVWHMLGLCIPALLFFFWSQAFNWSSNMFWRTRWNAALGLCLRAIRCDFSSRGLPLQHLQRHICGVGIMLKYASCSLPRHRVSAAWICFDAESHSSGSDGLQKGAHQHTHTVFSRPCELGWSWSYSKDGPTDIRDSLDTGKDWSVEEMHRCSSDSRYTFLRGWVNLLLSGKWFL